MENKKYIITAEVVTVNHYAIMASSKEEAMEIFDSLEPYEDALSIDPVELMVIDFKETL